MAWIGRLLYNFRGRDSDLAWNDPDIQSVPATITITSNEFNHEGPMPVHCTRIGEDKSPHLQWTNVPEETQELVMVLEDPDAPIPWPAVHTVVINIPPTVTTFAAGVLNLPGGPLKPHAEGWQFAKGMLGRRGYHGPGPPPGHGSHRYFFEFFALKEKLPENAKNMKLHELLPIMKGKMIARGLLIGQFERPSS